MAEDTGLIFTQTDTAAPCGAIAACSGGTVMAGAAGKACVRNATAGIVNITPITVTPGMDKIFACWQLQYGLAKAVAGVWSISINVTTAGADLTWTSTYVCVLNAACSVVATLGTTTGSNKPLSSLGVKDMGVNGIARVIAEGESLYIVCLAENAAGGNRTVGILPDQDIDSKLHPGGPFDLEAYGVYVSGPAAAATYVSGATKAGVYVSGATAAGVDI